ncbi:tetratricopeptide repeat protein [Legionella sp. CNM-4043-24]|uniref:tetratricopeptide repeat protein n=1 Tax=Legionella sp. CNM-4043-24 TaxID=3421646 RepID=UPI00403AA542
MKHWAIVLLLAACDAHAFSWVDLWSTHDQQAAELMQKKEYRQAQGLFENDAWRGAAAYRAGDFEAAATDFGKGDNEQSWYNQGNALARAGKLEEALKAYDKSLAANPDNKDARYNRDLVASLLKKQQNEQQKKDNKDNKDKQDKQDKQQQSNKDNSKQQENNNQAPQQKPEKQSGQEQKEQGAQSKPEESKQPDKQSPEEKKQEQSEQEKKQSQGKANQNKEEAEKKSSPENKAAEAQRAEDREKQQAKEQWLRLIPDDPGGLLREKFLRDYMRRQNGWSQ